MRQAVRHSQLSGYSCSWCAQGAQEGTGESLVKGNVASVKSSNAEREKLCSGF